MGSLLASDRIRLIDGVVLAAIVSTANPHGDLIRRNMMNLCISSICSEHLMGTIIHTNIAPSYLGSA